MSRRNLAPEVAAQPNHELSVGVVIVTYNSAEVIADCLNALCQRSLPVVVVDNASTDDTREIVSRYPVQLIENGTNLGFGAAANRGFQVLPHKHVLLLNPDVCLETELAPLEAALSEENIAVACGALVDAQRVAQYSFQLRRLPSPLTLIYENLGINRLFPGNRVNRRYRYADTDWKQEADVEQPAGAFLLIRRDAWLRLQGFDERFFPLWFEDVDFCLRLQQAELRIRYLPLVVGQHLGAHSIRRLEPGIRQLYWYRSLLHYSSKHFSFFCFRVVALSVIVSATAHAIAMARFNNFWGNPGAFSKIIWLSLRAIFMGRLPSSEPSVH